MIRQAARVFCAVILLLAGIAVALAGLAVVMRVGHLVNDQGGLRDWLHTGLLLLAVVCAMIIVLAFAGLAELVGGGIARGQEPGKPFLGGGTLRMRPRGHGGMQAGRKPPPPPGPVVAPKPPDHRPVS